MKCAEKNHENVSFCLCNMRRMANIEGLFFIPPHILYSYVPLLCGFKVHSVLKVKLLFDRTGMCEHSGETCPLWWRQISLCRLHEDKLLGKNWNTLCQWCNSLDFSDSKEFGNSIIFYDVVVKIPVIIMWRNQFKALCFSGKVLSPLELIFLGLSMWAGYHATGAFVCFGNTRFFFRAQIGWNCQVQ